jgi:hypothetical protein
MSASLDFDDMDVVATSRSDPELDLEHPQDSGPTSHMSVQDSYQFFEAGLGYVPNYTQYPSGCSRPLEADAGAHHGKRCS